MRRFFSVCALLLLAACLEVKDFNGQFEKGIADPCVGEIAQKIFADYLKDGDPAKLTRSFKVGEHKYFLMVKQHESDVGGRMYHFTAENGIFTYLRPNPTMHDKFHKDYPDSVIHVTRDNITVDKLDDAALKLLESASANGQYWQVEDRRIYTPMVNAACTLTESLTKN